MAELLDIYRAQFKASFANYLQYRVALLFRLFARVVEPLVNIAIWSSLSQSSGGRIASYADSEFSAYFIVVMVVNEITFHRRIWSYEFRIRTGTLTSHLLRPVALIHRDLADVLAAKALTIPMVIGTALGLILITKSTSSTTIWAGVSFVPVLAMAFLLSYVVDYLIALLAFWTTRTEAIDSTYTIVFLYFLAGRFAPLAVLPEAWQKIASLLPFRWVLSFPVEVLLGRLSPQETLGGLAAQTIWLAVSLAALPFAWQAALRRYTGVEGSEAAL